MALLAFLMLLLVAASSLLLAESASSSAKWCVCKQGTNKDKLQEALDYACGDGADCAPIGQNMPCHSSNLISQCSYAVNSYYLKMSSKGGTCAFSGVAAETSSDPSFKGCTYPSSASSSGAPSTSIGMTPPPSMTPSISVPSSGSPVTTPGTPTTPSTPTTPATPSTPSTPATPTTASPYTGAGGVFGVNSGLGPSGPTSSTTMNTDDSHGELAFQKSDLIFPLVSFIYSVLVLLD